MRLPSLRIVIPDVTEIQQKVLADVAEQEKAFGVPAPREMVTGALEWAAEQRRIMVSWRSRIWSYRIFLAWSFAVEVLLAIGHRALVVDWVWDLSIVAWMGVAVLNAHALGREQARGPALYPYHALVQVVDEDE